MSVTQATTAEARAHAYARERGVSPRLYAFVRGLAAVVLRGWFRFKVSGAEHIPSQGPAIVAPNHKNFLDPFFIGIATRRHVRYMAKVELLRGPAGSALYCASEPFRCAAAAPMPRLWKPRERS